MIRGVQGRMLRGVERDVGVAPEMGKESVIG